MQYKQITVEISRTHNLGNYSNIKPTVSIIVALSEGDNPEQAAIAQRQYIREKKDLLSFSGGTYG